MAKLLSKVDSGDLARIATFVYVLLIACGVSNALAIALFAGVADVLPYIGAFLAVGASAAAALSRGPTSLWSWSC